MSPRELAAGAVRTLLSELVVELTTLDDIAERVIDARITETEARSHATGPGSSVHIRSFVPASCSSRRTSRRC